MIDALYDLLKSFGFDEPLHSPITHMPIGLVVGALVFVLIAFFLKKAQFQPSARHSAILAFVFVFPTILLGVFDWIHYYNGVLMPAIVIKMVLAGVVLLALGAVVILGSEIKFHGAWLSSLLALSFVAVMGLGYFGAGIIYGRAITIAPPVKEKSIAATEQPADPAFVRGRKVFAMDCQACHGNGGNALVASLPVKGSTKLASLEKFTAFVREPSMPDGSSGDMPGFPVEQISEADMSDLYVYVSQAW